MNGMFAFLSDNESIPSRLRGGMCFVSHGNEDDGELRVLTYDYIKEIMVTLKVSPSLLHMICDMDASYILSQVGRTVVLDYA